MLSNPTVTSESLNPSTVGPRIPQTRCPDHDIRVPRHVSFNLPPELLDCSEGVDWPQGVTPSSSTFPSLLRVIKPQGPPMLQRMCCWCINRRLRILIFCSSGCCCRRGGRVGLGIVLHGLQMPSLMRQTWWF